ncbi:MAG: 50S ribosomal protein L25 [Opitutales bacterium]|nr:50S ribosomal protein L25 [Opitutales bacterium]MCH8539313.1 50S ribosomal protein L25 [Opitutales bacterium]
MNNLKINASPRSEMGRRSSRRLRGEGHIPAVVYGKKEEEPRSLQIKTSDFRGILNATKGAAALIELQEGDRKTLTVVQEIQHHPVKDLILHVDFHEVSAKEEMETQVVVHINGEAFGVKNEGGVMETVLHELTIRCLPKDLPEFIEVDVSDLKIGGAIHIKDLPEIPGVTLMGDDDQVIVSCSEPRISAEATEEAEEESAEKPTEEEASSEKPESD